jgi:hypothetical protein
VPTSIPRALRLAASDFYFNSLRFVPANVAWALVLLGTFFAAITWPPAVALVVLTAVPLAGLHRMAALLARDEPAGFSDFVDGMRKFGRQAIAIGAGLAILAAVLVFNVITGFGGGGPLGWFLGATALWGLVGLAMYTVAIWPVLVDPGHAGATLRRRMQLAGFVVIGRPGRLFVLTILIAAIIVASTVVLGLVILAAIAYVSLLATRWVLPSVDALEARYEAARASR